MSATTASTAKKKIEAHSSHKRDNIAHTLNNIVCMWYECISTMSADLKYSINFMNLNVCYLGESAVNSISGIACFFSVFFSSIVLCATMLYCTHSVVISCNVWAQYYCCFFLLLFFFDVACVVVVYFLFVMYFACVRMRNTTHYVVALH